MFMTNGKRLKIHEKPIFLATDQKVGGSSPSRFTN
jgi:hypothetical protein